MAKKLMSWKTKGMNRDLSVSAFNPEFAFENINLRLSTNEGNTMLSWVNEKSTSSIELVTEATKNDQNPVAALILGVPIGTAVINHKLVLFTTFNFDPIHPVLKNVDFIYVLSFNTAKDKLGVRQLYNGTLNFCTKNPIETLVSYEAENIEKVYWVDGRNQPRMINIDSDHIIPAPNGNTQFDFVSSFEAGTVSINKSNSGGIFTPGVIQYAFSYINKHGQQSNLFYVSSLFYLSYADRGASPEENVLCSFSIDISNPDTDFDYVRIYSIQRTSLNGTPIVKVLDDLSITTHEEEVGGETITIVDNLTFIDNGSTGYTIDPTELFYVGGKEITALTMSDKDGTLFLGNITEKNSSVETIQKYFDDNRGLITVNFVNDSNKKSYNLNHSTGIYEHTQTLAYPSSKITTFKGGETYRFGFQLQKNTGEWTEPIYIDDFTNPLYPDTNIFTDAITLPTATLDIDLSIFTDSTGDYYVPEFTDIYKQIRPVVVFPSITDRNVLCQGVVNPTVFNIVDRVNNSPFAQPSWFFRPYFVSTENLPAYSLDIGTPDWSPTNWNPAAPTGFENDVQGVHVLVGGFSSMTKLQEVVRRGELNYREYRGWSDASWGYNEETVSFNGAIFLGQHNINAGYQTTSLYYAAFIKTDGVFYNPYLGIDEAMDHYYPEYTDADILYHLGWPYKIYYYNFDAYPLIESYLYHKLYNQMNVNDEGFLYYTKTGSFPDSYKFDFKVCQQYYNHSTEEIDILDYQLRYTFSNHVNDYFLSNMAGGNNVEFLHYNQLYIESGSDTPAYEKEEIQGSFKTYNGPFDTSHPAINSNTQFFVDQSIVTLNSPDIEFDTTVQNYASDDCSLHIVGIIPITANVSAHSILNSTGLLESSHNLSGATTHFTPIGELAGTIQHNNIDVNAGSRLVARYLWSDAFFKEIDTDDPNDYVSEGITSHLIYPWHRSGSLNNDFRSADKASSLLETKKESTMLYSINSKYGSFPVNGVFNNIDVKIVLQDDGAKNVRLDKQCSTFPDINYYPNIDRVLYNEDGYKPRVSTNAYQNEIDAGDKYTVTTPISMKYKSMSHAVIVSKAVQSETPGDPASIYIMPKAAVTSTTPEVVVGAGTKMTSSNIPFWTSSNGGNENIQNQLDIADMFKIDSTHEQPLSFLWLAELHKTVSKATRFGGQSKTALKNNTWLIGGEAKAIDTSSPIPLDWTEGDTYYQRYDCLKTYAYTHEDANQIIEILSFLCETHVNIDGRYDQNRGQVDNTNMNPQNFNLLNSAYTQRNNFFSYKNTFKEEGTNKYPNLIVYSKAKEAGADVDLWTNVTLASTLEANGNSGEVNSIRKLNDSLIVFQDSAISQILYNENTQISTAEGMPIEIANSGKVTGMKYITDTIGCSNKWSIVTVPSGLYFMDSNNKDIYLFNGQLRNVSLQNGFNAWSKQNIPSSDVKWNPVDFDNFVSYYDPINQDILFINKETCLAYSEKLGVFTSFYSYEDTPYFCSLDGNGLWIKAYGGIWKHRGGDDYCKFFGENKPYGTTLVGNPEPQTDKTFTNLEFRACVEGDGEQTNAGKFTPTLPFDSLETWNEYQHGMATLENRNGHDLFKHHPNNTTDTKASLKRMYRMWRCDIPRDNVAISEGQSDTSKPGLSRYAAHPIDRMRNPWLYLKLGRDVDAQVTQHNKTVTGAVWEGEETYAGSGIYYTKETANVYNENITGAWMYGQSIPKVEIHDLVMTYFN